VIPVALTIAGSDPSGGAGIQADLKTFSALKVYGMSVISALTAQNTKGITGVLDIPPTFLGAQLDTVLEDIRPGAVKTGMLYTAGNVETAAQKVRQYGLSNLIVDPVMTSTSGSALLAEEAVDRMRRCLLPLALIVTPNTVEAGVLTGRVIRTHEDMEEAALQIHSFGPKFIYLKGGHLEGAAADVLFDGHEFTWLTMDRIMTNDAHGTGCVLSAAATAYVARGEPVASAVRQAKDFVTRAIGNGLRLGSGAGPCDPLGIRENR
jgi:hydroxymethylpyrimidine/phosphomethylpyrimidine kinase